jgi:serine/threonine-protein kinase RsbW
VDQQANRIVLEIIDEAPPMPAGIFASASPVEFDESAIHDLPEGGFGLALIKMNMDEVEYTSSGGRNHLRMTKHYGRSNQT